MSDRSNFVKSRQMSVALSLGDQEVKNPSIKNGVLGAGQCFSYTALLAGQRRRSR